MALCLLRTFFYHRRLVQVKVALEGVGAVGLLGAAWLPLGSFGAACMIGVQPCSHSLPTETRLL